MLFEALQGLKLPQQGAGTSGATPHVLLECPDIALISRTPGGWRGALFYLFFGSKPG